MAASGKELYSKVCMVDAVDEIARTVDCSPIDETAPLLGVNLQANQDSEDGIVQFPSVGSYVVVSFVSEAVAVVVLAEKVDKIMLKIGATTAELTGGKIIVNGGTLGGLVKIEELHKRLESLEKSYNNHVHGGVIVAVSGGSGAPAVGAAGSSGMPTNASTEFQGGYSDYENDKITQ